MSLQPAALIHLPDFDGLQDRLPYLRPTTAIDAARMAPRP